jgi:lysophospholipase L1-like esterase
LSPFRKFIFLFSVLATLLCLASVFPPDGIAVTESITLYFPTAKEVFLPKERKQNLTAEKMIQTLNRDSVETTVEPLKEEKIEFVIDSTDRTRLHYPENNKAVLYPFFELLDSVKTHGGSIRVLHYGDSQIEEDRMTGVIRARLQQEFGGSGSGLMCPVPVAVPMSMQHSWSGNFDRYVVFGNYWDQADHNRYGVMCAFSRYTGNAASLSFKRGRLSFEVSRRVERVKILYGYGESPSEALLTADGVSQGAKLLRSGRGLHSVAWTLDSAASELKLQFSGESPDLYAVALDAKNGVCVDNIPIRGSSGLDFTKLDSTLLADCIRELNVRAVILQFGGNVVPVIKGQKDLDWYRQAFAKQLAVFKAHGLAIVMIGLADMSTSVRGEMMSYPAVSQIRDITKEEVHKVGGVFWDMYDAMGGENSMPEFVKASPPLAIDDYIHFNRDGAAKMARLFVKSLMRDYNEYKTRMELKSLLSNASTP